MFASRSTHSPTQEIVQQVEEHCQPLPSIEDDVRLEALRTKMYVHRHRPTPHRLNFVRQSFTPGNIIVYLPLHSVFPRDEEDIDVTFFYQLHIKYDTFFGFFDFFLAGFFCASLANFLVIFFFVLSLCLETECVVFFFFFFFSFGWVIYGSMDGWIIVHATLLLKRKKWCFLRFLYNLFVPYNVLTWQGR